MHPTPDLRLRFRGLAFEAQEPGEQRYRDSPWRTVTKALTITTAAAEPACEQPIAKAELVIRRQDWHPVQQRLNVSEPDGFRSYEIRETSFEVVALGSLGASVFEQTGVAASVGIADQFCRIVCQYPRIPSMPWSLR